MFAIIRLSLTKLDVAIFALFVGAILHRDFEPKLTTAAKKSRFVNNAFPVTPSTGS